MSDQTITTLVTAVVGFFSAVFTGVMAYYMAKLKTIQDQAAVKTEAVAVRLEETNAKADEKLDAIAAVTDSIHIFTNAKLGAALADAAASKRRLADISKDATDIADARRAELMSTEHKEAQSQVDKSFPKGVGLAADMKPVGAFTDAQINQIVTALKGQAPAGSVRNP